MLTPKWIVVIFRNLCKLGEGGKMAKVLVILEAGNPACKVNSIKKPRALVFLLKGWLQPSICFSFGNCFLEWSQHLKMSSSTSLQFSLIALPMEDE